MGYVDENGNSQLGNTPCYHVDMTVSITTKEQASVTFHLQDAGKNGYEPVEGTYTVDLGTEVEPTEEYPVTKFVDGIEYEFNGWYDNEKLTGEPVEFPYTVTEAVDFYAKYEPKEMVTILYQAVGGEEVKVTKDQETFAADAGRDAAKGSQAVKTDGYVFNGWYDNAEGTGQPLDTGYDTFKPERPKNGWENDVYYAVFEKIEESEIDGPYVEIDDVDNDKEYYQGSVNVEVYLDGEKVEENSRTIHYGYEQYNCVDLELTYPENEKVVLNAIYAKQVKGLNKPKDITADFVDNVKDGSTVYIYLSSVYTVEYTAENAENVEQDDTKYTLPNSENHWDYNSFKEDLTAYGTRAIHVKDLPKNSRYTYEGWFAQDATEVEPGINWRLKEAIEKADANNVIYLHATSKQAEYNLTVEHVYKHADGTKDTIVPDNLSGVYPAGTTITVEARDTEGYRFDGFLMQTDVATTEYGDAYRTLTFKTYPSDMYVQVLYVEEPAETYELHVEHVYKHADGTKDRIEKDEALSGVYPAGTTITVEARDTEGYRFDGFLVQTDAATTEYGDAYRTLTFKTYPSDMYVQVLYVEEPVETYTYNLEVVHVYLNEDGTTKEVVLDENQSGEKELGELIKAEKTEREGYEFTGRISYEVSESDYYKEYTDKTALSFRMPDKDVKVSFYYELAEAETQTQTYTIHHLEEGTDKVLAEDVVETAAVGSVIDGKDKQLSINGYAFVSATTLEVKADSEQNHVYVYYGKDSIGPDGDNDPDGEPDAYQIVFTFKSSDEAKGTLSGTTRQVYTFKDNDGNYVKPAEGISQRAVQQYLEGTMEGFEAVTITSKEGYEFDYWTVENQEVAPDYTSTMDELGNTPFTQDTTFVVYFSSVGGSSENPGGDSGSGGNSGGGGGGSSSGPSGSGGSSTAGPGVTITDGDVPLAPLPSDGSGSSAVIYDDNVPLAPLPKTGQESLKAPLTALFAGIFLALASLKRRKEEN